MAERGRAALSEMRALRVHAFGEPPRLERVPVPEPGPEDVLVEVTAGVIGHHDLTVARGDFPIRPSLPYTPGLEGAGRVLELGTDVDRSRLAVDMPVRIAGGGLGESRPGTWGERVAVTARAVTPVPETLDPALAAAYGTVAATAWAAVLDRGALQAGERVGVTGASGAVGSLAAQLALAHGAGSVVAWTRAPERASLPAGVEVVAADESAEPVDLLVDTTGGPLLAQRLACVRPGGRAVLVGYAAGTEVSLSIPHLLAGDVALLPLNMMRRRLPKDVAESLLREVADGTLRLAVERVSPEEATAAIERIERGEASARLVLAW